MNKNIILFGVIPFILLSMVIVSALDGELPIGAGDDELIIGMTYLDEQLIFIGEPPSTSHRTIERPEEPESFFIDNLYLLIAIIFIFLIGLFVFVYCKRKKKNSQP